MSGVNQPYSKIDNQINADQVFFSGPGVGDPHQKVQVRFGIPIIEESQVRWAHLFLYKHEILDYQIAFSIGTSEVVHTLRIYTQFCTLKYKTHVQIAINNYLKYVELAHQSHKINFHFELEGVHGLIELTVGLGTTNGIIRMGNSQSAVNMHKSE